MKEYDFDPRNLPQEALAAIGLAVASSAQTESMIEMAIAGCAGVDIEYGGAITTHMAAPLRFSVLRSVAEIRINDLDDLDELDCLLDNCKDAFDARNGIAHHTWCQDPDSHDLFTVKQTARARYEMDLIPMTVDQVKLDAAFIYWAGMDLMTFLQRTGLLPSFPPPGRTRAHKSKAARKTRRKKLRGIS